MTTTTNLPRINGRHCRPYVQGLKPFRNSNGQLYATWVRDSAGDRYIVYSYGEHWPLHIWDSVSQCWYSNTDRRSRTTSRHYSQAHPLTTHPASPLNLHSMLLLAQRGYAALAERRVTHG